MSITKFVILGHGRSGTTILCDTLNQSSEINMFQEIFNYYGAGIDPALFDFDIPVKLGDCKIPQPIYEEMARKKYCIKAHKKYHGYKLLFCHLINDVREYLSECAVILICRRNKLQVEASHAVAQQTNVWNQTNPFDGTITLDTDQIERNINRKIREEQEVLQYNPLIVYYEDNMKGNIDKICDFVGMKRFEIEYKEEKRIRKSMSDLITNYDEVKHLDREVYIQQ